MKTPLTYGFLAALGGAIVNLLLYFAGLHDSMEKLTMAQIIGGVLGLAIIITCLSLAMRDKRASAPADAEWGYGAAFGVGLSTAVFMILFGAVSTYVYMAIVNPGFSDIIYAAQVAKMEEKGMSSAQIASAEPMMRKVMSPIGSTIFQAVGGAIFCTVIAAIVAIFFRKPRAVVLGEEPPVTV
jgi:ABC-type Fe3+ transport system permease subunit